jgi:hypothetical protein
MCLAGHKLTTAVVGAIVIRGGAFCAGAAAVLFDSPAAAFDVCIGAP